MDEPAKERAIRRARLKASLLALGSLAVLLAGAALTGKSSSGAPFLRPTLPLVFFLFGLLIAILFPAYMRIYYILLLDAKGVFTPAERRAYQAGKQRWERYLLRAALVAGVLLLVLGVWVKWHS